MMKYSQPRQRLHLMVILGGTPIDATATMRLLWYLGVWQNEGGCLELQGRMLDERIGGPCRCTPDKEERRCRCSLDGRMVCMYLGRYVGM